MDHISAPGSPRSPFERPNPLDRRGIDRRLDLRDGIERDFVLKTVGQWQKETAERGQAALPIIQNAMTQLEGLDAQVPMRTEWMGYMRRLHTLVGGGDPARAMSYMRTRQTDLKMLNELPMTSQSPLAVRNAIAAVNTAMTQTGEILGPLHPALSIADRHFNRNPAMAARESHLVRSAVVIIAAGLGILTTALTLKTDQKNRNWKLPAFYFGVAGIGALWHSLNQSGTQRYRDEITWLTEPGGRLEQLRAPPPRGKGYGIRGPQWAQFIRNFYERGRSDTDVSAFLRSGRRPSTKEQTEAQRKAILALAPAEIHPQINRMLGSANGPITSADMRTFLSLLASASSPFARDTVGLYIASGEGPEAIQEVAKHMASRPGTTPGALSS